MNKRGKKHCEGRCLVCGEGDYRVLDVHRIAHGGPYTWANTVTLCCKCHRLVHAGEVEIVGWKLSTAGRVLHWRRGGRDEYRLPGRNDVHR